jgi:hypothetical protein
MANLAVLLVGDIGLFGFGVHADNICWTGLYAVFATNTTVNSFNGHNLLPAQMVIRRDISIPCLEYRLYICFCQALVPTELKYSFSPGNTLG